MKIGEFNYFNDLGSKSEAKKVQGLDLDIQLSEPTLMQPLVNENVNSGLPCILTVSCSSCQTKTPTVCVSC